MTDRLTDERLNQIIDNIEVDMGWHDENEMHTVCKELLELRKENELFECEIREKAKEIDRLNRMLKCAASDWADTDTDIRKQVSKVLDPSYVYGDSDFIPPVGDLVEELIKENKKLQVCHED